MIQLLIQQQIPLSVLVLFIVALIISLTFHEYGHGIVAKYYGDDTAEKAGRLTLNPLVHLDPLGSLMVVLIGIGYAKPVPTNPANFNSRWATPMVAAAGPAMNLLLATVVINFYVLGMQSGWSLVQGQGLFFTLLASINLMLMLFNLIPIGPLDGHYILPYFLPRDMAIKYMRYNQRYGTYALLALIGLNLVGIPVFMTISKIGKYLLSFIVFV
jgi:Zn-dependent protease